MAALASIDLLRNVPLFAGLDEAPLQAIAAGGHMASVRGGTTILAAGTRPDALWVVLAGHVRIVDERLGGQAALDVLGRGAHFGEAVLDGTDAPFSVQSLSDVDLLVLPLAELTQLAADWPEFDAAWRDYVDRRPAVDEHDAARTPTISEPTRAPVDSGDENATRRGPAIVDGRVAWKARPYVVPAGAGRRRPLLRQARPADAGPACLASICRHYGRDVALGRIREAAGAVRGPATPPRLRRAAESLGFEAVEARTDIDGLRRNTLPALARTEGSHWVVVHAAGRGVTIGDPAAGISTVAEDAFARRWTGDVVFLRPTEAFGDVATRRRPLARIAPYLVPLRTSVIELFAASVLIQALSLALPVFARFIIDDMIARRDERWLVPGVEAMAVVIALTWTVSLSRRYLLQFVSKQVDGQLATDFYRHLLALPARFFEDRAVGDIVSRFDDTRQITRFLTGAGMGLFIDVTTALLYLVLMFAYSVPLTLVSLAVVAMEVAHLVLVTPRLGRGIRETFQNALSSEGALLEALSGLKTIKILASELFWRWRIEHRMIRVVNTSLKTLPYGTAAAVVSQLLTQASSLAVLFFGALLVLQRQLTVGELVAFGIVSRSLAAPFANLASAWRQLQDARNSIEQIGDVFDTPVESGTEPSADQIALQRLQGHVRFERVTFRYDDDGPAAVQDVSFECYAGQRLAIVGPSGSGKSTLVKMMLGLYRPTDGHVSIDGFDLADVWLPSLRRQSGAVLQDPFLFRGPIRANIAQAAPSAGLADVVAAARLVNAHGFISALPHGYETVLDENGSNLSGGQRQQVALARALLQRHRLLLFDEATSNLDNESERMFRQSLDAKFKDSTVVTVTQRITAVQDADLIVVMDRGRIVERGRHAELMAAGGMYHQLFVQQNP